MKLRVVQEFFPTDWEARSQYCRWFQESISNVFLDLELVFFFDEVSFTLGGNLNSQNNRCNVPKIPMQFIKFFCKFIGSMFFFFFQETVNSDHYVLLILTQFFRKLKEEKENVWLLHAE
jgi:hypothetical protein